MMMYPKFRKNVNFENIKFEKGVCREDKVI